MNETKMTFSPMKISNTGIANPTGYRYSPRIVEPITRQTGPLSASTIPAAARAATSHPSTIWASEVSSMKS